MARTEGTGLRTRLEARNAERIRTLRTAAGLSQASLAELVGTSQQTIDRIERGETAQSRYIPEILKVLGVERQDRMPTEEELATDFNHLAERHGLPSGGPAPYELFVDVKPDELPVYLLHEVGLPTISSDVIQAVRRPPPLERVRGAYALLINTNIMSPALRSGDLAFVHPHLPARRGDDVIIRARGGQAVSTVGIGSLVSTPSEGGENDFVVHVWAPATEIRYSFDEWDTCHVIIGKYSRVV